MIVQRVDECINVVAHFINGKINPIAFSRSGKRYKDLKILSSKTIPFRNGVRIIYKISYENNIYEIHFDSNDLVWFLKTVFVNFKAY